MNLIFLSKGGVFVPLKKNAFCFPEIESFEFSLLFFLGVEWGEGGGSAGPQWLLSDGNTRIVCKNVLAFVLS